MEMEEDEDITIFFLNVDGIVNTIRGLGETINEYEVVHKIIRSLPSRFIPKVSSIEEMSDLQNMKMNSLHRIITTYKIRIEKKKLRSKEDKFTEIKETNR